MIAEDGDRVMVCPSGGKDSYTLLDILVEAAGEGPGAFLEPVAHLDQKQPGYDPETLPNYLRGTGVLPGDPRTGQSQRRQARHSEGKTMCSSAQARGARLAVHVRGGERFHQDRAWHHRDDIVETMFRTCSTRPR